jgi:hypothetical protein
LYSGKAIAIVPRMSSRRPARFDGAFLDAIVFIETNDVLDRLSGGDVFGLIHAVRPSVARACSAFLMAVKA